MRKFDFPGESDSNPTSDLGYKTGQGHFPKVPAVASNTDGTTRGQPVHSTKHVPTHSIVTTLSSFGCMPSLPQSYPTSASGEKHQVNFVSGLDFSSNKLPERLCEAGGLDHSRALPKQGACRFRHDPTLTHDCKLFPCHLPITYHTLGYRREDLCPWASELSDDADRQGTIYGIESPMHRRILPNGKQITVDANMTNPSLHRVQYLPKWSKGLHKDMFHFQEIDGPLFTPIPVDPILEQVRSGAIQARDHVTTVRTTVPAKIRGLKQLVKEMKARNDSTRPADWAVNYGARVPTRLLLNPVRFN